MCVGCEGEVMDGCWERIMGMRIMGICEGMNSNPAQPMKSKQTHYS